MVSAEDAEVLMDHFQPGLNRAVLFWPNVWSLSVTLSENDVLGCFFFTFLSSLL